MWVRAAKRRGQHRAGREFCSRSRAASGSRSWSAAGGGCTSLRATRTRRFLARGALDAGVGACGAAGGAVVSSGAGGIAGGGAAVVGSAVVSDAGADGVTTAGALISALTPEHT